MKAHARLTVDAGVHDAEPRLLDLTLLRPKILGPRDCAGIDVGRRQNVADAMDGAAPDEASRTEASLDEASLDGIKARVERGLGRILELLAP